MNDYIVTLHGISLIENNTWQNLYHTPYQPENPIYWSLGLIWGVIQFSQCIVVFIMYLNFLIRIELTWFIKNFYAFEINQRKKLHKF